jgi:hemoglobin/transferrin/lactoferrin receptor protein
MNFAAKRKPVTISAMASICEVNVTSAADKNSDKITVTAAVSEHSICDITGTVSVIGAEPGREVRIRDICDLMCFELGISVSGGGRFGLRGFTVRGIGGDRVLTQVDCAPKSDKCRFVPFISFQRGFVGVDAVKVVEIVRGPSSSLWGGGAFGGVV